MPFYITISFPKFLYIGLWEFTEAHEIAKKWWTISGVIYSLFHYSSRMTLGLSAHLTSDRHVLTAKPLALC